MKRDMDLIRKLLLDLETRDKDGSTDSDISLNYPEEQILYHAYLLVDARLATGFDISHDGCALPQYSLLSLTWNGHEFLEAARNETNWNKAKNVFAKAGGILLPVLFEYLASEIKKQIGL